MEQYRYKNWLPPAITGSGWLWLVLHKHNVNRIFKKDTNRSVLGLSNNADVHPLLLINERWG